LAVKCTSWFLTSNMLYAIVKAFLKLAFGRHSIGALLAILIDSFVDDDMHLTRRAWKATVGGYVRLVHKYHYWLSG